MNTPIYNSSRGIWICFIDKSKKDNRVCKKGEPYLWVRKEKSSPKEFFKDIADLDKKYPKYFSLTEKDIVEIIKGKPKSVPVERYVNKLVKEL